MYIVTQDRDRRYRYNPKDLLLSVPVFHEGLCMGYNLLLNQHLLGTFDTSEEALREAQAIVGYKGRKYRVRGFCDWKGGRL